MLFLRVLAQIAEQTALTRIWNRISDSISNADNRYTKYVSNINVVRVTLTIISNRSISSLGRTLTGTPAPS